MKKSGKFAVGMIVIIAIGVIVALTLLTTSIAPTVTYNTGTYSKVNQTVTAGTTGNTVELTGRKVVPGSWIVTNATNDSILVNTANFTMTQALGSDGQVHTALRTNAGDWSGQSINVSYSYEPDGYIGDLGAGTVFALVIVLCAIGIAVWVFAQSDVVSIIRGV